jgi:hypothetical protein
VELAGRLAQRQRLAKLPKEHRLGEGEVELRELSAVILVREPVGF